MTELFLDGFEQPRSILSGRGQSKSIQIRKHKGGCRHLVKMYNDEALAQVNPDVLQTLVNWRWMMSVSDQAELDRIAGVPRHTVLDTGRLVGVALPVAPQHFWFKDKSGKNQPRDASKLCAKPGLMVEHFSQPFRYAFLGHFLKALLWLHDHDAVLGDISLQNVLVGDDSSCYVLDLDSAWLARESAFGAIENKRFSVAFSHTSFTPLTDRGKFAIVAIKVLGQDSALKNPTNVQDIMTDRHYRLLTQMWKGEEVRTKEIDIMADAWIKCSVNDFGQTFNSTSTYRIIYTGDANVFSRAGAVDSDICVGQHGSPPRPRPETELTLLTNLTLRTPVPSPVKPHPNSSNHSWVWWLAFLVLAVAVWWFFLH